MKLKSNVIILAAGQSSRMGHPKSLLPFRGKTLLDFQIDSIQKMGVKPIVVLGYHHSQIQTALPNLEKHARLVINPNPEQGQFSSLLFGLKSSKPAATFILPIDTPAPAEVTWDKIESHLNSYSVVVPRCKNQGGHPVLLSSDFVNDLCSKEIPETEKRLDLQIKKLKTENYFALSTEDPAILVDLDTPDEVNLYFKCL